MRGEASDLVMVYGRVLVTKPDGEQRPFEQTVVCDRGDTLQRVVYVEEMIIRNMHREGWLFGHTLGPLRIRTLPYNPALVGVSLTDLGAADLKYARAMTRNLDTH